jgi:cytochrome c biogenesis protein CcdA/thiol-disulfide isomerase/thioredoxin
MSLLLLFSFFSGLSTILAPCIWPILPIVLASSTGGKQKPLGISLGIVVTFTLATLGLSYLVRLIPFDPNILRWIAVGVIIFLGLMMIIPWFGAVIESWVSRLFGRFSFKTANNGFGGGFITGLALGLVWAPCAGPILATIAVLAATQAVNLNIILMTLAYSIGAGLPLLLLTSLGQRLFSKTKFVSRYLGNFQKLMGVIMIATAVLIIFGIDLKLAARLADIFPEYSSILTKLESQPEILNQLNSVKNLPKSNLKNQGQAPEFTGITKWLNSDPLTIAELRGKVVLVDFWTYTCINCIRTLPHITAWYEKYKDQGFVVVGVHTPEFEFEKTTTNVENALKQYNITYPVAQDNNYATWNAYQNHYWPAHYLIDTQGVIRKTHFGEGEYEEMESAIQDLLGQVDSPLLEVDDSSPRGRLTPETYLGSARGGDPWVKMDSSWSIAPEYAQSRAGSTINLDFQAKKVFLVITPVEDDSVRLTLDGQDLGDIKLDTDRLYDIVSLPEVGKHKLLLKFSKPGTKVFAFTFG